MRILLLGGTTEASHMARALADRHIPALFSYAGRTDTPITQPLPTRIGGFGGAGGLGDYLRDNRITHVIDATHPFAARISANAVDACEAEHVPLVALERAPWTAGPGDDWRHVATMVEAAEALPGPAAHVFLAIGRQQLDVFAAQDQHRYLLRLVDLPEALPFANAEAVLARGPFTLAEDLALMQAHRIDIVVAKNAGGTGARAKLDAARELGLPVILIDRPEVPRRETRDTVQGVLDWLHATPSFAPSSLGTDRGE